MSFLMAIPAFFAGGAGPVVLGAAGTAMSAVGAVQSGQSQSQMARYNAEMTRQTSEYNAQVARQGAEAARRNAETIRQAGEAEAARQRQKGSDLLAQQRAAYGAAGVEFEGSPLLVMQETAARAEQDALAIRYNYQVKAAKEETEAWKMGSMADLAEWQGGRQANLQDYSGGQAATAGWLGGATSLLKGAYELFKPPLTISPLTAKVK